MKVILINGSPRKNWNTHKLLMETERGAKEAGAETELIRSTWETRMSWARE